MSYCVKNLKLFIDSRKNERYTIPCPAYRDGQISIFITEDKMKHAKFFAVTLVVLAITTSVFAESTPISGLSFFKLDNGLEVFVLENHTVPLTRIQITFRCGALTQTPETCGIFHLYEHMLFKGNAKYKTETEFAAAMTELGIAGWNGSTSTEYVEYHITLPSNKTGKGLEFWSYAMRSPLFDKEELEIEKDVVCNEINGDRSRPTAPIFEMKTKMLFPKFPWRRDVGGYDAVIRAATQEMLKRMQKEYYIPNNAAIFVSGDVKPGEVLAEVKKYYGDWEKGKDPWNPMPEPQLMPAVKEPVYLVYPDTGFYQGLSVFYMYMRGPDVVREPKPTYAADVWGTLYGMPAGKFKENIFKAVPNLYEKDQTWAGYYTQRDGGELQFGTVALIDSDSSTAKRAKDFTNAVYAEVKNTVEDKAYFENKDFASVKRQLEDEQILSLENPDEFISTLSFWWSSASADYFFKYLPNMNKVGKADIDTFLQTYVLENQPIVIIRMNAADYKREAKNFKAEGFKVITRENCFWWGDK